MGILLASEYEGKPWGTRDRDVHRDVDPALMTGPDAKEAEIRALQPGCCVEHQPGKLV